MEFETATLGQNIHAFGWDAVFENNCTRKLAQLVSLGVTFEANSLQYVGLGF
jgi:hypothetical protein